MEAQNAHGQGPTQQPNPARKNSELLKEAQATFSVLPHKEAEDLREFLNKNSDNIRTYDLTEENLKWLKQLRKCSSWPQAAVYSSAGPPAAAR